MNHIVLLYYINLPISTSIYRILSIIRDLKSSIKIVQENRARPFDPDLFQYNEV